MYVYTFSRGFQATQVWATPTIIVMKRKQSSKKSCTCSACPVFSRLNTGGPLKSKAIQICWCELSGNNYTKVKLWETFVSCIHGSCVKCESCIIWMHLKPSCQFAFSCKFSRCATTAQITVKIFMSCRSLVVNTCVRSWGTSLARYVAAQVPLTDKCVFYKVIKVMNVIIYPNDSFIPCSVHKNLIFKVIHHWRKKDCVLIRFTL